MCYIACILLFIYTLERKNQIKSVTGWKQREVVVRSLGLLIHNNYYAYKNNTYKIIYNINHYFPNVLRDHISSSYKQHSIVFKVLFIRLSRIKYVRCTRRHDADHMDCCNLLDLSIWMQGDSLGDEGFHRPNGAISSRLFGGRTFYHVVVQTKPLQRSSPNRYAVNSPHTNDSKCTRTFQIIRKTKLYVSAPLQPNTFFIQNVNFYGYCLVEPTWHGEAEDDDNIAAQVDRLADRMDDIIMALNAKNTKRNYCFTQNSYLCLIN